MSEYFGSVNCNPVEMTQEDADRVRKDIDTLHLVKKPDCSFYNACLEQAVRGNWANFSCASCAAYAASERPQLEMDALALRALQIASDRIVEYGKLDRIRGVKEGSKKSLP
jgi:hypothetical protein